MTIRSDWKEPGPADDLWIATTNVHLSDQAIATSEPVEFRWGAHFGRGREMVIKLVNGPGRGDPRATGMNVSGIASFEIQHVERLHIDLGQTATTVGAAPESVPVEVACQGPFQFDVIGRVATFRDAVDVRKLNANGPVDQILCNLLSIYFIDRPKPRPLPGAAKVAPNTSGSLDLVAQRLEARARRPSSPRPAERSTPVDRGSNTICWSSP